MTASEMFKELGYEFEKEYTSDGVNDTYRYNKCSRPDSIIFDLNGKNIIISKIFHTISLNELQAIIQQINELGWLEDEKQEIKKETNIEHYFDDIGIFGLNSFAVTNGKPMRCKDVHCDKCDFCGPCGRERLTWLTSPYKNPTYKLTQFEYDLIQTFDRCKECCLLNEIECLKKLSEKGYFKGIDPFTKVHDIIDNCEAIK